MPKPTFYDRAVEYSAALARQLKDVAKLPEVVRNVAIVVSAQGIVDNGGLQYLFEADFPGKPDYALFVAAYRAISAGDAAEALAAAVALFPFASPHRQVDKRNAFMDSFKDEEGDPVNSPFEPLTKVLCGHKTVWAKLEQYVNANAAMFPEAVRGGN